MNTIDNGMARFYREADSGGQNPNKLSFSLPEIDEGTYDVRLTFIEPNSDNIFQWENVNNKRLFDITIEGNLVADDFNIVEELDSWNEYLSREIGQGWGGSFKRWWLDESERLYKGYQLHAAVTKTFEGVAINDRVLNIDLDGTNVTGDWTVLTRRPVISGIELIDANGNIVRRINVGGDRYDPEGSIYISQKMAESMFVENRLHTEWTDEKWWTRRITDYGWVDSDLGEADFGAYRSWLSNGIYLKHGLISSVKGQPPTDLAPMNRPKSTAQLAWEKATGDRDPWDLVSNLSASDIESTIVSELALVENMMNSASLDLPEGNIDGLNYADNHVAYKETFKPAIERMLEMVFWNSLGRDIWRFDIAEELKREPPESELEYFTNRYLDGTYGIEDINKWLNSDYNNNERDKHDEFKTIVTANVLAILNDYVANNSSLTSFLNTKTFSGFYEFLAEQSIETVKLTTEDVAKLEKFLNTTDLHFGRSAFDSLIVLLGLNLSGNLLDTERIQIATALIFLDIVLGILHSNVQESSWLNISMYSMQLVAGAKGKAIEGYNLLNDVDFDDALVWLSKIVDAADSGVIVYTNENHFLTITSITPDGTITVVDNEETRILTRDEFEEMWGGKIIADVSAVESAELEGGFEAKELSVVEMRQTTGGCPGIAALIASIVATIGAVVAAVVAVISAIVGIIGSVLGSLGPALLILGTVIMGFGSGLMLLGGGWMTTGFALMGSGSLLGFIAGAAMVVAGAAVWAVGAIVYAAGYIVKAIGSQIVKFGESLQNFGTSLKNLSGDITGVFQNLSGKITEVFTNLTSMDKWFKYGIKGFMNPTLIPAVSAKRSKNPEFFPRSFPDNSPTMVCATIREEARSMRPCPPSTLI